MSDRSSGLPTLEERADDIRAVLDAVEVERAAIYAASEGGQAAMYFAATYPDRVSALALVCTASGVSLGSDEVVGDALTKIRGLIDLIETSWGQGMVLQLLSGAQLDPESAEARGRFERNAASPAAAADILKRSLVGDATAVLGLISAPTLVVSRLGDPILPPEAGRALAAAIPGARLLELDEPFHLAPTPELDEPLLDALEEFFTGSVGGGMDERVLATVMFTDIVDSTKQAASLNDAKWRQLLDDHDAAVRQELERHRGHEVKTTGDGFLATFDGPARAVRCAQAIIDRASRLGLDIRSGVHTGEVERRGSDIAGLGVHIANRVAGLAGPGEVLVSSTVRDLTVGSGLAFDDAGVHTLKGVPGEWQLLRVMA